MSVFVLVCWWLGLWVCVFIISCVVCVITSFLWLMVLGLCLVVDEWLGFGGCCCVCVLGMCVCFGLLIWWVWVDSLGCFDFALRGWVDCCCLLLVLLFVVFCVCVWVGWLGLVVLLGVLFELGVGGLWVLICSDGWVYLFWFLGFFVDVITGLLFG